MNIGIVSRSAPIHGIGGMQDHLGDLAAGLARAGHDVRVITSSHPRGLTEDVSLGVRWRYVDAPGDNFASREWRSRSLESFRSMHREEPFDVVHGEGSSALELVRSGVHRSVPLVVMFHGNYLGLAKASLRRQLRARRPFEILREQRGLVHLTRRHFAKGNWRVFRACEAIVPSRQQLNDTCRSHRLDPGRVHVVPNGVDPRVFAPRSRAEVRKALELPDGLLFICAGRLTPEKGTRHAVRVLSLVRESVPSARLLIVGDGAERPMLEQLASTLKVADRVIFAGAQPSDRMPLYLAAADAFLFPTERDEAAPLILLQAMACGLPVVASSGGSIAEVMHRPGEEGLLVPPGDVRALTDAVQTLGVDESMRGRLGSAARARVKAVYTLEQMIEKTLAVYRIAMKRLPVERERHRSGA